MKQRSGSLRKTKNIDKPLLKLIKRQRESIQISKIGNEKGNIIMDTEKNPENH